LDGLTQDLLHPFEAALGLAVLPVVYGVHALGNVHHEDQAVDGALLRHGAQEEGQGQQQKRPRQAPESLVVSP
jgi:hypothetical protein